MPRRKHFKSIADNINQQILSRNFDAQGYWAVGKLYKFAEEHSIRKVVLDLKLKTINPESNDGEFSTAIQELAQLLYRSMESNKMPEYWLQEATVTFSFKEAFQAKYHFWGSALGQPFICSVYIKTDLGRVYIRENGCNCWIHDPHKELRRYGF